VRGRGWAATAVEVAIKDFRIQNSHLLKAQVKKANVRSRFVFRTLGFVETSIDTSEILEFQLGDAVVVVGK
jgi:L-amino acid N-acyltransferase YncA